MWTRLIVGAYPFPLQTVSSQRHNPARQAVGGGRVDSLLVFLGLSGIKPVLTALALPPAPLLLLALLAGRMIGAHRSGLLGRWLLLATVIGLWLSCCAGVGAALERWLLRPPAPLTEARLAAERPDAQAGKTVVLILGGGREALAPEYGEAALSNRSAQRLHYGLWLARRLGAPAMFAGGTGMAQLPGPAEAEIAARVAERDYGRKLRWVESTSRNTRENAAASLSMLQGQPITEVVLVTHGWHMRRALRAFEDAARRNQVTLRFTAAPMGLAPAVDRPALNWIPTAEGFTQVRQVARELLGLLMGA